jgi:hypothetical protein
MIVNHLLKMICDGLSGNGCHWQSNRKKFGSFLVTQARPLGFWHQVKSALAISQIKLHLTKNQSN